MVILTGIGNNADLLAVGIQSHGVGTAGHISRQLVVMCQLMFLLVGPIVVVHLLTMIVLLLRAISVFSVRLVDKAFLTVKSEIVLFPAFVVRLGNDVSHFLAYQLVESFRNGGFANDGQ